MRVIAGRLKGRQLVTFKQKGIRPMTDRVKETVFNKLMRFFPGADFLDLFSGTGSLSIEAVSRGAGRVVAVEKSKNSLQVIKQNLKSLAIDDEIEIHQEDVFTFLKSGHVTRFDVVVADPPFTQKLAHKVMESLAQHPPLVPNGWVIIESSRQERIDDDYSGYKLLDRKEFGDKRVSFFEFLGKDENEEKGHIPG